MQKKKKKKTKTEQRYTLQKALNIPKKFKDEHDVNGIACVYIYVDYSSAIARIWPLYHCTVYTV